MELVTLKCPSCGADIEIENGIDTFYCKYCGYKIILDGQSDAAINAKVRMKEMESNERIKKERLNFEREERTVRDKRASKLLIFNGITIFLVFLVLLIMMYRGNKGVEAQERKLQAIVDEIMIDIDDSDFAEARVKANMLYWVSDYTDKPKKKWDQIRIEILNQIDKAEQEAKKKEKIG